MIAMPDRRYRLSCGTCPGSSPYLSLDVDLGSFAEEQGRHVRVALLRRQMKRSDALLGHDVGLGSVLKQNRGDLHLVLLGGDVERRVAVLVGGREGGGGGVTAEAAALRSALDYKDSLTLAMVWGEAPLSRSRSATFWLS